MSSPSSYLNFQGGRGEKRTKRCPPTSRGEDYFPCFNQKLDADEVRRFVSLTHMLMRSSFLEQVGDWCVLITCSSSVGHFKCSLKVVVKVIVTNCILQRICKKVRAAFVHRLRRLENIR